MDSRGEKLIHTFQSAFFGKDVTEILAQKDFWRMHNIRSLGRYEYDRPTDSKWPPLFPLNLGERKYFSKEKYYSLIWP